FYRGSGTIESENATVQHQPLAVGHHAEYGAVIGAPHQGVQSIAGKHRLGKVFLHAAEAGYIVIAEAADKGPAGDIVGTQPVENGLLEAVGPGPGRFRAMGMAIPGQPVYEGLVEA